MSFLIFITLNWTNKYMKKSFGENIKEIRLQLNLTQAELAKKLGYSERLVGGWENNRSFPTVFTLKKIHDIFGVDYEEIFDFEK